nr:protein detoxification 41 [Quercus suber]
MGLCWAWPVLCKPCPILIAIGQFESIAEQGQVFAHGLILQLYAFAISCPMQSFFQAQNIVNPLKACISSEWGSSKNKEPTRLPLLNSIIFLHLD